MIRAGTVPLRNFSSNWLGWMYASTICDTVKKLLGDAALDVDQRKSLLERVEEARDSPVGRTSREQMSYEGADGGSDAEYRENSRKCIMSCWSCKVSLSRL